MGDRRRSLLWGGTKVPDSWFLPEDLPAEEAVYAMFKTKNGDKYLVPASTAAANEGWFTDYTFVTAVLAVGRYGGGFSVYYLNTDAIFQSRYKYPSTGAAVTPGVISSAISGTALNDTWGKANQEQTLSYYENFSSRDVSELEAMVACFKLTFEGCKCYMPSLEELRSVKANVNVINSILSLGNKAVIPTTIAFSSGTITTTATSLWIYSNLTQNTTSPTTGSKSNSYYILPVAELDVIYNNPDIKPELLTFKNNNASIARPFLVDDEGWYNLPAMTTSTGSSVMQITITTPNSGGLMYRKFRVEIQLINLQPSRNLLFSQLGTTSSTYTSISGSTSMVDRTIAFDYINTANVNSVNLNVTYQKTASGVDSSIVRFRFIDLGTYYPEEEEPELPEEFLKLEDVPYTENVYALFKTSDGEEYCVLDTLALANSTWWWRYDFIAPVLTNPKFRALIYPNYVNETFLWNTTSSYYALMPGVTQAANADAAAEDFRGKENTEAAADYYSTNLSVAPLINKAMSTVFADRQAYLPAGGQLLALGVS